MLRNARPVITSSARAAFIHRTVAVTPRHWGRQVSQSASTRSPKVARNASLSSRALPIVHKTHYATTKPPRIPQTTADPEDEKRWAEQKLEAHPESVSSQSSVRHLVEPTDTREAPPMSETIKHDLNIAKDTFALNTVPKESYYLGLAGTVPYLVTSVGNVYLSWVLSTGWPTSSNFLNGIMITHDQARDWLGIIEPLQMGYGAVIISFLGAIHWGLEYAEKHPSRDRTRFRYGVGVLSSVVAWPTLFLSWQFALTAQFAAFVGLYYADARASARGWAPYWYRSYRFVLTAIVGVSIMISLIGRAKVGETAPRLSGLNEKFHQHGLGEEPYSAKWARVEEEEKTRQKKEKKAEEKKQQGEEARRKQEEQINKSSGQKAGKESNVGESKNEGQDGEGDKPSLDGKGNEGEKGKVEDSGDKVEDKGQKGEKSEKNDNGGSGDK